MCLAYICICLYIENTTCIYSENPDETQSIGNTIGRLSFPGDLILMTGELGAGKTCFTQGLLNGLGSVDCLRSPTFVLMMEHKGRIPLYHADLYRISKITELESIGLDEYLNSDGICVVEWADRFKPIFQLDHLAIKISWDKSGQHVFTSFNLCKCAWPHKLPISPTK